MIWFQRLLRRRKLEEQLEKELSFHVEQHAAELTARGLDPKDAKRQARLTLGGPEQVKEECRDARGTRWLEDFWQDFGYALRGLRQRAGFTMICLFTLAVGIGATTVMFTVVNGVLLKPLPYPQADRLIAVHGVSPHWNATAYGRQNLALPDLRDLQNQSHSMELAGWLSQLGGTLSNPGEAEYVDHIEITANFFHVLGVEPIQGRAFLPEEDRLGGVPVAVISHRLWKERFGANPSAVGTRIVLNDNPYTIVGVMPGGFQLPNDDPDIFTPVGQDTQKFLQYRQGHPMGTFARLRQGATLAQAQNELVVLGRQLARQYPDTNAHRSFQVERLGPPVGDIRATLWLLLGAMCLVLLIACANIASLLLARAVSREREFAMRAALGAGRGRLARQCLTESAVLGLAGGGIGVLLAGAGVQPFVTMWPNTLPRAQEVSLDCRVLLFALGVSLVSGLIFGLAPALRAPWRNLEAALRSGSRTLTGGSRHVQGLFATAQMGLAVVLLVSAGVLGRTLTRIAALNPGVNIHNVLVARAALSQAIMDNPQRIRAAWKELLDKAGRLPGVEAVAMTDTVPLRLGSNQIPYWNSSNLPPDSEQPMALADCVSPDYLRASGVPLLHGRFLDQHDRLGGEIVVVIDQVLAQQAFGTEEAVGRQIWFSSVASPFSVGKKGPDAARVVGVVGHVRYWGLAGDDQAAVRAQFYYSFDQVPDPLLHRWSDLMSIVVRTSVPPLTLLPPLRQAIKGDTNDQVLFETATLEQYAAASIARQRFLLVLFGIFAGIALLLACIGIYGVLADLASQRVREMGLRLALGATARDVFTLVLRQGVGMIAAGVLVGAAGAIAAVRLLRRFVEGVRSMEPFTFAAMVFVLVVAALLASYVPARRASRVDPVSALRAE